MKPPSKMPLLKNGAILNGKWEILEHMATGGKGEVYRARQTNLDRDVVIKTVSVEYLAEFGEDTEEVQTEIERFHREAMAMAQVRHPFVVQVYDHDSAQIVKNGSELRIQYVVMEYIPGPTLRSTMPEHGFGADEKGACNWIHNYFLPILDGIKSIHELGIVHRDIKPENVLLDGATPKITDFGIAGGVRWQQLTRSHHVEGTISYMAPEQFMDLRETDARGDVYALGKILYEAMCGKMVDSRTACPLKGVFLNDAETSFLKGLDLIVQQATAEDKDQRTLSIQALKDALAKLVAEAEKAESSLHAPALTNLHRRQVIALAALLLIIAGAFVTSHLYHHFAMTHEAATLPEPLLHDSAQDNRPPEQPSTEPVSGAEKRSPPPVLLAKDGSIMRLVPGGQITVPDRSGSQAGKLLSVSPVYLQETEVTNAQYVEFLNQALKTLTVKDGLVQAAGRTWLVLGELFTGYEPIIFRNGRFLIQNDSWASYPVVRVTGYGAYAYAHFYGARLPSEPEWLNAVRQGTISGHGASYAPLDMSSGSTELQREMENWIEAYGSMDEVPGNSPAMSAPSQVPHRVSDFKPDMNDIRGLAFNVSEWGIRPEGLFAGASDEYVILGGPRGSGLQGGTFIPGVAQNPSGAFGDVGFRCALSAFSHAN